MTGQRQSRLLGIVGGLGPYAHLELERHLLVATARRLGRPARDQDYPEWVVSSIPSTPDRTASLLAGGRSPVPDLVRSLERLERAGADFAIIPCNTAHAFLDVVVEASSLPVLDLVEITVEHARRSAGPSALLGLLATTGTCVTGLYHRAARRAGMELVTLLDLAGGASLQERLVSRPIHALKSGDRRPWLGAALDEAAQRLLEVGAIALILGCTEIPLGLDQSRVSVSVLDPLELGAERALVLMSGDVELDIRRAPSPSLADA